MVINYIRQRIEISDEELEEGLRYSVFKKYTKGKYIIRIGEYCRFIGFINKGLMVTTTIDIHQPFSTSKKAIFPF
ncbi:hypothetical protein A3860_34705 [Niastella vici]|uniref:Cyclic nucleotide-binding domain-containing protein n=2 Tax=Niastella vici TaxID=1703345 RepID=A0A1V9FP18_9BACT|nr:hypothetical protein A3860_34705 [Niastella vici]